MPLSSLFPCKPFSRRHLSSKLGALFVVELLSSVLVLSSGASAQSTAEATQRIFILRPSADAALEAQSELLVGLLASEIRQQGFEVVTTADLKEAAKLESMQRQLGCEDDASCLTDLAARAKADLVIRLRLGKVGRDLVVTASLLDPHTASVQARVSTTLEVKALASESKRIAQRLLGRDARVAPFTLPEGGQSFAVLDLEAAGVSAAVAKNLTQVLSAELKKVEGATVIGRDDIAAMLQFESDKEVLGCQDDTSCLAEIGDALGVDRLVVGQVGKIADSFVVSLRLIRTSDVTIENRVTETFRGQEEQLLGAVRFSVRKLVGLKTARNGSVLVSCSEAGAILVLDGQERGSLPLPPVAGLSTGRHEIRVSKNGFFEFHGEIYVEPGAVTTQWVPLDAKPAAFYETWQFWTVTGGIGAATFAVAFSAVAAGAALLGYEWLRPRPLGPVKATLPVRE